jgi:hypothetical protein
MPSCILCNSYFKGRGAHCNCHNYHSATRVRNRYNYNSDSTEPSSIGFRNSNGNGNRPRTLRFADTTNMYGQNTNNNAVVRYDGRYGAYDNTNTALAQPLINTFTKLSNTHAISSLTCSYDPSGGYSFKAEANLDRERCNVWFADYEKLQSHQWEFSVGCEEHGVCMRMEDVQWHATTWKHERCFFRGCHSQYRRKGRWMDEAIEYHVLSRHR